MTFPKPDRATVSELAGLATFMLAALASESGAHVLVDLCGIVGAGVFVSFAINHGGRQSTPDRGIAARGHSGVPTR